MIKLTSLIKKIRGFLPCAAGTVYIRYESYFRLTNITKFDKIFFSIIQYLRCLFLINRNIFHRLRLAIALAIPAWNE